VKVILTDHALNVIDEIAAFVESKNTPGSGKRYALKFKKAIEKIAKPKVKYAICNHERLALLNYSCGHYNDWVIAFRIENNALVVYQIIHGSFLA